uniref:Uncharacterized protein n=1 Tax=Arundo donax TaxID=35708 RepID=A0A0A8ZM78_ARUDO
MSYSATVKVTPSPGR